MLLNHDYHHYYYYGRVIISNIQANAFVGWNEEPTIKVKNNNLQRSQPASKPVKQGDQMTLLFFKIWPFKTTKICQKHEIVAKEVS